MSSTLHVESEEGVQRINLPRMTPMMAMAIAEMRRRGETVVGGATDGAGDAGLLVCCANLSRINSSCKVTTHHE